MESDKIGIFSEWHRENIRGLNAVLLKLTLLGNSDYQTACTFWKKANKDAYDPEESSGIAGKIDEITVQHGNLQRLMTAQGLV